jgi:hypothetical protein
MLKNAILPLKTLFSGTLKMNNQYLTVARPQAVKAKGFASSPDAKEKMLAAGVQGPPDIVFLSEN